MRPWQKDPLLKVEHLTMRFGGLTAVDDVSFEVGRNDITALIGPNGAGKTTVFNCITGFYKPTEGSMELRHPGGETFRLERLDDHNINSGCRTQPPSAPTGKFAKDRFTVDLDHDTVTCPNGVTVSIQRGPHGDGSASFAEHCITCPLRSQCTDAIGGRTIHVSVHEAALARARQRQTDPDWQADYRANRPKVERKLAHLMRRRHGGRRARVRGRPKVDADFNLLAAAANLARLAVLGLRSTTTGWSTTA